MGGEAQRFCKRSLHRLAAVLLMVTIEGAGGTPSPQTATAASSAAPAILGWSPAVTRNVPLLLPLTVYFNRPMDHATVEHAWHLGLARAGSAQLRGTFRWSDWSVSFTPSTVLRPRTNYSLSIDRTARSTSGMGLESTFSLHFSTGEALRIVSYSPWKGTSSVPISGIISVTFNHPMVPLAGLSRPASNPPGWSIGILPRVSGHGSWLGTSTWVFHPQNGLQPSTSYTVVIPSSVRDASGEPLHRPLRSSFRTITPEVFSRSPRNGARFVDPRTRITVTFNQPMDHKSTANAFSVRLHGARIAGTVVWRGTTLVFSPRGPLNAAGDETSNRHYVVNVARSARSANGKASLGTRIHWSFATAPSPRLLGTDPTERGTTYAFSPGPSTNQYPCCYTYSVSLHFNAPMDKSSLDRHLTVSPQPPRLQTWFDGPDRNGIFTYGVAGDFAPSTTYTITLASGIRDQFGRLLPPGSTYIFKTSRLYPSVALFGMPGREGIVFSAGQVIQAPLQIVNVPEVHYTLIRTNLYDLGTRYGRGTPAGKVVRHWTEKVPHALNTVQNPGVALSTPDGKPLGPGLYWLDATAPTKVPGWHAFEDGPPDSSEIVAVTNVSLTVKSGGNGTLVWVTSAATGKPLAGIKVRLTDTLGNTVISGMSNASGIAFFKKWQSNEFYAAVVNDATHYSMATTYWQPDTSSPSYIRFPPWNFSGTQSPSGTYLYTDRPIYRPGQRVNFRGLMWLDHDGVYGLMGRRQGTVQVSDSSGHPTYSARVTLDRFGAFHGSFSLPRQMATGPISVYVNLPGTSGVYTSATVAEYRKPEFLTSVTTARPSYAQGQTVKATVTVHYVFGAPVVHQNVAWTAYLQPRYPAPPGWDAYSFFDSETYWQQSMHDTPGGSTVPDVGRAITSGTGITDAAGHIAFNVPVNLTKEFSDGTITLEATTQDVNHQSVSGRIAVPAYKADVAIGLSAEHDLVPAGQIQTVHMVAVKHDGTAIPGTSLVATVFKRTYSSKLVNVGNHTTSWQAEPHDVQVEKQTLTTDSGGKATLTFTPKDGGEYYIEVETRDGLGNTARNALSVYASAEGFSDWGSSSTTSVNLKPDRSSYAVGETAHILVPAPFDHATALITVERGNIRRYSVTHLATNSPTVDIPITRDDVPNVYISVTLYRGWRAKSPPDWRYGTTELHVKVDPRHLIVHLHQNGYRHHPGDALTYTVTTTNAQGKAVSAQLSLALIDTSVLALQSEVSPDILQALYSERSLTTTTVSDGALSIDHLREVPGFQIVGAGAGSQNGPIGMPHPAPATGGGGGGGGPQPGTFIRSRFADTAYWAGGFETNASGRGTIHVKLPDNATTWRLDVRGITTHQAVGQGQLRTLATQDLVLRPVLPRFLTEGDHLRVGTVLNNTLGRPVDVRVSMSARGVTLPTHISVDVRVPAHGERLLLWPASVPPGSSATILLGAHATTRGVHPDAVRVRLPVHPPLTDETVATSGQVYGTTQQMVLVPRNAVSSRGSFTVQISSSLGAGLGASWNQFRPTSYESNDDVANRVLVAASLRSLPQPVTGLPQTTYRHLPASIAGGIGKLLKNQLGDGGWPWFNSPFAYTSDPFTSADALQAIAASGWRGPLVRSAITRARIFLASQLSSVSPGERAHLILILARTGSPSGHDAESLYSDSIRRSHLSAAPLADLGMALSLAHDTGKANAAVSELQSSAKVSSTGAHWESSAGDYWAGPPVADTGEVVSTLLILRPHDPLVPAAVRWLMLARQGDGWDCPHDTAQIIATVAAYARAAQEGKADYRYSVMLNGTSRLTGRYTRTNARQVGHVHVRITQLHRVRANNLTIARGAQDGTIGRGPLYYLARLHYYLPANAIAPRSEGVSVRRRYLTLHGQQISRISSGSAIRVELTIHTDGTLVYLNLQDPIPSGFEPIDESLNTSQRGLFGTPPAEPSGRIQDLAPYLMHGDLHDNRVSLYAYSLPPGTYRYTYLAQATVPGTYGVAPTHISETFFPEVFGRSAGQIFTVTP